MTSSKSVLVFTDGAAKGNPGPGGWGAVLLFGDEHVLELGGGEGHTTNNRMELTAAIRALEALAERSADAQVSIHTDSRYLLDGVTRWVASWRRRGWKTADGHAVRNRDLWEPLCDLAWARTCGGGLAWHRVAAHAGIAGNERADRIASDFALGADVDLYDGPAPAYGIEPAELRRLAVPDAARAAVRGTRSRGARGRAYSYLSLVDGVARRHESWAECERLVKGRSGARYRKTRNAAEEARVLSEWGVRLEPR